MASEQVSQALRLSSACCPLAGRRVFVIGMDSLSLFRFPFAA